MLLPVIKTQPDLLVLSGVAPANAPQLIRSARELGSELADLLYHLEVSLASRGLGIEAPATVLNARRRDG